MVDRVIGVRGAVLVCSVLLFAYGCKSKEGKPVSAPVDSIGVVSKKRRLAKPPVWRDVVSGEGETLQVDQIAIFGAGCPRFGDPDLDGILREGCPLRAEKRHDLRVALDSLYAGKGWAGDFRNSLSEGSDCKNDNYQPYSVFITDSVFAFLFMGYFDSIVVRHEKRVAFLDFRGFVSPENRGYPKDSSGDPILFDGLEDASETILLLKAERLDEIIMTSPSGMIRGDYIVKNRELIPVSKKSLWLCK